MRLILLCLSILLLTQPVEAGHIAPYCTPAGCIRAMPHQTYLPIIERTQGIIIVGGK